MSEGDQNASPAPANEQASFKTRAQQAGVIVAVLLLAIFLLQNLQQAEVNFLWFEWTTRMIWALIASAAIGAVGLFLTNALLARRSERNRRG